MPGGGSLKEHLDLVNKWGFGKDKLLEPPVEFPPQAAHLWRCFNRITMGRQAGPGFLQAITYQEILAFVTLLDVTLWPWEVHLIKALDMLYLRLGTSNDRGSRPTD